jgi:hypothetical protein
MNWKFWLLQALGWTPYALLQLLTNSDDRPLAAPEQISAALLLVALAVSGSLLLRALYRRLQSRRLGELGWLAMSTMGRVKDSGGSMDVTYRSRGPTAALTIGLPPTLYCVGLSAAACAAR